MLQPVIDVEATCRKIKKLCEERGISAADLKRACSPISIQACFKWLEGKNLPNVDNLVIISRLLDVPIEEILVVYEVDNDRNKEDRICY